MPGIILSLPSGTLARYCSDKLLIGIGLATMAVGYLITGMSNTYELTATGRLITLIGATLANLFFTKSHVGLVCGKQGPPVPHGDAGQRLATQNYSWPHGDVATRPNRPHCRCSNETS